LAVDGLSEKDCWQVFAVMNFEFEQQTGAAAFSFDKKMMVRFQAGGEMRTAISHLYCNVYATFQALLLDCMTAPQRPCSPHSRSI
jgi:hypothetical protein